MTIKQPEILNKDFYAGTAGRRLSHKPKYYILHNDAGSATGAGYESWLKAARTPHSYKAESGFAHYYISADSILRAESTANATWSTASYDGNYNSIGYEVCQELSATNEAFRANEEMTLRQMAEDMTYYGDTPNAHNIKFHNEFTSTSCPKRSMALHGEREGLRRYVIERIKYYQSLGKTVKEMIDAENAGNGVQPSVEAPKATPVLSLRDIARLVIKGRYGNGQARIHRLQAEGHDPKLVQAEVDRLLGKRTTKNVPEQTAGTYEFTTAVLVRREPSLSSRGVAQYEAGERVNIEKIVQAEGRDWGVYKNYGGTMSYVNMGVIGGERYTKKV
ncbi:N-acetylmuramoyl-L-alanine amidase [Aerococcaceae bacterium NML160702]|nr:N-acetylmuramoyl-L-alanine amidase [Aerococcaceae bacterium NML160702]